MVSMKRVWQNWWMQLVAGLLITAIAVLPWLWIGEEDGSILPHANGDAQGLVVIFFVIALWSSWFARRVGFSRTGFTVVTAVGVVLGLALLTFQGLYALEPQLFNAQISQPSTRHLWVCGILLIFSQVWYFLSSKLRLPVAALFYATLTVGLSYWLQTVASLIPGTDSYEQYLWYAGPLVLGLILGFVGFRKIMNLMVWVLALAIQGVMPAVVGSTVKVIQSQATGWDVGSAFWNGFSTSAVDHQWQTPGLVTLGTALLTAVTLLIARKVRRR